MVWTTARMDDAQRKRSGEIVTMHAIRPAGGHPGGDAHDAGQHLIDQTAATRSVDARRADDGGRDATGECRLTLDHDRGG